MQIIYLSLAFVTWETSLHSSFSFTWSIQSVTESCLGFLHSIFQISSIYLISSASVFPYQGSYNTISNCGLFAPRLTLLQPILITVARMTFLCPNLITSLSFTKLPWVLQCVQWKDFPFQHKLTKSFSSRLLIPHFWSYTFCPSKYTLWTNPVSLHSLFLKSASFFLFPPRLSPFVLLEDS